MANQNDVIAYLRDNPEFFKENEQLLADLVLPNSSGDAPFAERQIQVLRERDDWQKARMAFIVDSAMANQKLENDLLSLSITLLADDGTLAGSHRISGALCKLFDVAEAIVLTADDDLGIDADAREQLHQRVGHLESVCDDRVSSSLRQALFGENHDCIRSCAFVPVVFEGDLDGVLVFGSQAEERFQPDMAVDYLDRIGRLIGAWRRGNASKGAPTNG